MTDRPPTINGTGRPNAHPWPDGTAIHPVAFVVDRPADHRLLGDLPPPLNRRAVVLPPGVKQTPALELLSIPCDLPDETEWCEQAREWAAANGGTVQTITFQGAVLVWGVGRAAVLAPAARLPALEAVLAEVAHYESELRETEAKLGEFWPELEADAGPGFAFDDKAAKPHRPARPAVRPTARPAGAADPRVAIRTHPARLPADPRQPGE